MYNVSNNSNPCKCEISAIFDDRPCLFLLLLVFCWCVTWFDYCLVGWVDEHSKYSAKTWSRKKLLTTYSYNIWSRNNFESIVKWCFRGLNSCCVWSVYRRFYDRRTGVVSYSICTTREALSSPVVMRCIRCVLCDRQRPSSGPIPTRHGIFICL